MTSLCGPEVLGADPAKVQWTVVRGDTATLRVQFLQEDEVTAYDMTGWDVEANVYDYKNDASDELEVTIGDGYVDVVAPSDITENWGDGFGSVIGELYFDVQVTLSDNTVWTPITGTVKVLGDITGSL